MRTRTLLLLSVCSFLLFQCSRLSFNEVSVVGRNFDDEVQQTQNLTFTLNKNIGPTHQLNEWDSTQYVRFIPAVRGKFKWTAPNELVFSPARAFDPATDYRAELTDDLLKRSDNKDLKLSGNDITFHTPYLQLSGIENWWARSRETGQPVAKTRLNFNYPISSAELAGKLTVVTDNKLLTAQTLPSDTRDDVTLTLTNAPSLKNGQPLVFKVDKGLKVPNTAYVSKEIIEETSTLPSRYKVDVADVQTSFENNRGVIKVITTQELQPADLKQYYSVQPQIETTAELTENGFVVRGDFNETDTYVLTLTDQIRGVLGTKLDEPVTHDLFFGKMPASIQFANKKALYLSSKGARNIGLTIVNVPKVQVKIAKVYENNILNYLRSNRYEEYKENTNGEWGPSGAFNYSNDESGDLSDVLVNKTVETTDLPKVRGVSALNLALPDAIQPGQNDSFREHPLREYPLRGVYLVSVDSKDEAYLQANQLVSVSDIGLVARQTKDEVLVWANSIQTAEPIQGVDVTLVSSNNQSVYTLRTDGSGFVRFDKVRQEAPGFKIALLTARTDDDFNFLFLPDTQVETSRFEVEGKRDNESGFDAFVYGDRDIYRPGETIHFNTVIRSQAWQSVGEIPVLIRVLAPNGREFRAFRKTTNAQGAVATDVPLNPAAVTGSYTVEVLNANNVLLTSQAISVEEFVPDRIKVDVLTDRTSYKSGQTIKLSATAMNLFGPPASDRAYEMELQLKRKAFAPKGFGDYDFTIANGSSGAGVSASEPGNRTDVFPKELRQGRTNTNGQATERFPISPLYQDIGLLEGKLFVTVFDENGRPVNRLRRFDVLTQDTFFGVRLPNRYVATNAPVAVDLVAIDPAGTLRSSASALVNVVRYDYQTVIEKKGDGEQAQVKYTTRRREKSVYTNTLVFKGGKSALRYVPTVSGEYEIRVRRPNAQGYAATGFYAYGYGSTSASSFEVSQEGQVLMTLDKPTYQTGDKANVLFKAPFDGRLLVTVERNHVIEQHWLKTTNKSAEWNFSVGNEHLPNVYVTATLIRAIDNRDNLPLTVAHGFAPVSVQDAGTKLPVAITAITQSRSKTKQTIRIKTASNAQVTVAVVDEGILQLKNFKTPDPHGFFYQKRALEVGSHDLYALLYPELSLKSVSSTGGDGYDLERRVNPLSNGRVKLVALWSGILNAGSDGEAEFTVDIPQFSGDLRVMAVAYKDNAFGSANSNMKVADSIVISTGLPRFLTPGDQLDLPVNLSNTTKQPAVVTAQLTLTGPLAADSAGSQKLTIQPGRESRAMFHISAKQTIGVGSITVMVKGLNETFIEKTDITVRPAASLQKTTVSGVVAGGKTQILQLAGNRATDRFLPGTAQASVTLSRSPVMQYGRELSYLLGYPHGCLEQTISKAFPQIYFADLAKQLSTNTYFVRAGDSDLNPATNIRQAIQTIEGLQVQNGGFTMWPGVTPSGTGTRSSRSNVDEWATAYAIHFLTEAQEAGYEVRPSVLSSAIDFLTSFTNNPATETDITFDETGGRSEKKVASRTSIYALYALTVAGKPNRSAMNYYKQNVGLLTPDSRYLLASAFFRIGDTRNFTTLLPKQFTETSDRGSIIQRQTGGSYASPLRNLALVLDALVDTDRDNLQIPVLARQLSSALKQSRYVNTQEAVFAFLALGKLARQSAGSTATATLTTGGKSLGTMTNTLLNLKRVPTNAPLTLTANGAGNVYYFAQSEGVPATGKIMEEDNGLRVRREYLNRQGQKLAEIKQNDLVIVKVTLVSLNGLTVENVVVTDLLPAGLEVENPRLTESRDMAWISKPSVPDHFDLRDDRINFYTTATGTQQTYYYLARAVSKGRFVVGSVSADAMYNGDYRSYNGAGIITIR
ncbi:alpha-2-macroglobulin family protein [Spirosoma validum]|uniref:Alpha-2-macroglobulin family protein n=1 Tax=Spirosoma validum TaxID=2771355 RepID=A0A927GBZ2_9BACT|nr:MG2 domain-containing protein [Spirosoma validum]MBD2751990.1 alpha-2-macroglobulin family protein [Spirosoma validum]